MNRKDLPVFSGVLSYFPDALLAISAHSKKGNDKHNPGMPLHWDKSKSTDHADCIARHLIDIGPNWDARDVETGSYHATALAWRALALLQVLLEREQSLPQQAEAEPKAAPPASSSPLISMLPMIMAALAKNGENNAPENK